MKKRILFCLIACVLFLSSSIPCIAVESEANNLDFEYKVVKGIYKDEILQQYQDNGYNFSFGVEIPPYVIKTAEECEEYLSLHNSYNPNQAFDIFAYVSQLGESFFDEKALICIDTQAIGGTKYQVNAVTGNGETVVVEYSFTRGESPIQQSEIIVIEVNKSDIGDMRVMSLADRIKPNAKYKLGDINKDGYCGKPDYVWLKRYCNGTMLLTEEQLELADVNKDDIIDKKDYILIKRSVFETYVIE